MREHSVLKEEDGMAPKYGVFASKLCELDSRYADMSSRINQYQHMDHEAVRKALSKSLKKCRDNEAALQGQADTCRSKAVAELSGVQLDYFQKMRAVMRSRIPALVHEENCDNMEDRAEAAALYAEYAIDFAQYAMESAVSAVLAAVDLQMTCEERENEDE